jgi:iron complex outermembrane receptor protein
LTAQSIFVKPVATNASNLFVMTLNLGGFSMKRTILAISASIFAMTAMPAWAQDAAEEDAPAEGDIIVTATRSETLLSQTPLALTAITGEGLREQGIVGPTDLTGVVPNLSIDRTNGLQITIRGVTSTDGTEKGNPSAGTYFDDVYIARPQQADIGFFDISRVEVLRGPQGLKFGRNTTAGVVNIISNRPKIGEFGAGVNVGYGSFKAMNIDGFVNVPVGDTAAFRVAATFDQRDSYIKPAPGDTASLDPFRKNFAVRATALVELGDKGSILLRGNYGTLGGTRAVAVPTSNFFQQTGNGTATTRDSNGNAIWSPIAGGTRARLTRNLFTIPVDTSATGGGGANGSTRPYLVDNSTFGFDGEINYDLGPVKATYLGSYREYEANENTQLDIRGLLPTSLPGFLAPVGFMNACTHPTEQCSYEGFFNGDYKAQSHELRFALGGDGPLTAQAGVYYFREDSVIGFWIPDFPQFIIGPNVLYGFPQETTNETKGAFGEATFAVSDGFRITGGLRYTHDDLFRYGHTVATNNITSPIVIGGSTYANDARVVGKKITWGVGFDADVGGGLLYGSVKTGYKQGGFGDGCSTGGSTRVTSRGESCAPTLPQAIYYEPENIRAYEFGFRGPVFDGVRVDANVFYYDYKNLQLSSLLNINGAPTQVTTNAGESSVFGVEFSTNIKPADNHQVNFGINYLDAKYDHFCPGGTGTANPLDACLPGTIDFKGRGLDRSPKFTAFANYNLTVPLGDASLVLSAGTRLTSKYSITQFGATPLQYFTPSHTNTSLNATYNAAGDKWYVQAFAQNLENFIEIRNATSDTVTPSEPRTYGIRAGFKF